MSIEVNRRWAVHINIELARVGAHERVVSEARARSVAIVSSQDGILRPGELALVALVQLPDGAGVDAAWGALSSIPDVDATVERWSQEEAAELRGAGAWRQANERPELYGTSPPQQRATAEPSEAVRQRMGDGDVAGALEQHRRELAALKADRRAARGELGAIGDEVLPAARGPGAMRPETLRRIEEMMQEYPASDAGDLVSCARGALLASKPGGVTDDDILRAIAYLVRRLELDAPTQDKPR
jgi:hypothetical protein